MSETQIHDLTGPQKAATLMLALSEQQSAVMFAKMDDDDIRELSQAMANLGVMNASAVEQVLIEFASQIGTGALRGSFETTERALLAGDSMPSASSTSWRRCAARPGERFGTSSAM